MYQKEKKNKWTIYEGVQFFPSLLLLECVTHKMDTFLQPLVDEVKKLCIEGACAQIENYIKLKNNIFIKLEEYQLSSLLLFGHPITFYCESIESRINGCCRCLVKGVYIPIKRHYYHGNFSERYRNRSTPN